MGQRDGLARAGGNGTASLTLLTCLQEEGGQGQRGPDAALEQTGTDAPELVDVSLQAGRRSGGSCQLRHHAARALELGMRKGGRTQAIGHSMALEMS